MRKVRILTYIFLCILFSVPFLGAQYTRTKNIAMYSTFDSIPPDLRDSTTINKDSLRIDSIPSDTLKQQKEMLDAIVDYKAKDSIVLTADKWGYP